MLDLSTEVLRFAPENDDAKTFLLVAEETLSHTAGQEGWASSTPSGTPRTANGTAVPLEVTLQRLELIPGVRRPEPLPPVGSFDYGQETTPWCATKFPPDFLGPYPALVPTVDDDGNDLGGGDVEGVIEGATDHRLPLEQAIDIAKETCRGLEFAHSRGVVCEMDIQNIAG